ncbi:DUF4158 domain-containing protein [Microbispora bryophytorum]|uniref:DUF4158 domain-containing protein n=1 Tax=Microbispora bryophytorum TaxID=1460882 RepID=UPI0033DED9F7
MPSGPRCCANCSPDSTAQACPGRSGSDPARVLHHWPTTGRGSLFSEEQLEQLRSFPEVSADELIRSFTPTSADAAFVSPGGRGPVDRLGMLVQLCTLPWRGFVPDDVARVSYNIR